MDEHFRKLQRQYYASGDPDALLTLAAYAQRIDFLASNFAAQFLTPDRISEFGITTLKTAPMLLQLYALMYHHHWWTRRELLSYFIQMLEEMPPETQKEFYQLVRSALLTKLADARYTSLQSFRDRYALNLTDSGWIVRAQARGYMGGGGGHQYNLNEAELRQLISLVHHDYVLDPYVCPVYAGAEEKEEQQLLAYEIYGYLMSIFDLLLPLTEPDWLQSDFTQRIAALPGAPRSPETLIIPGDAKLIYIRPEAFCLKTTDTNQTIYMEINRRPLPLESVHLELLRQIKWRMYNQRIWEGSYAGAGRILQEGLT